MLLQTFSPGTGQDIDIIVERKGDQNADSAYGHCLFVSFFTDRLGRQPARINALKTQPGRIPSTDSSVLRKDSSAIKNEAFGRESQSRPGSSFPAVKTSNIDVDAKPIYEATGKPITDIDMDTGMLAISSRGKASQTKAKQSCDRFS